MRQEDESSSAATYAARAGAAVLRARRVRSPVASEREPLWTAALALVLAVGVVRLFLAAATPLMPDETYYWEWSRRLASGYFDHPPAIALLIAGGTALFGATPLGVRFFPVLAGVGAALLIVSLAGTQGGSRAAWRAALVTSCVPLGAAGLVLATPDAPLLFALALALVGLDRALASEPGSGSSLLWWSFAGAATGLALLSKYTAALLPAGVLLAFLLRAPLRRWLRAPEPYLAVASASAVFSPVLFWNARNDWASFRFQLGNGFGGGGGSVAGRTLELLASQLGLVSPILFALLVLAVWAALRRRASDRRFVLATVSTVIFGFFVYVALRNRVEANWPAAAYPPAFVLLALAAGRHTWNGWMRGGLALGAALVVLIYVQALHPVLPLQPAKDPVARAHGWAAPALAVAEARAAVRPPANGTIWFAANRYQDASQLAFHLPGQPEVFSLNVVDRANQYDFWSGFRESARAGDALILLLDGTHPNPVIARLTPHFDRVRRGERVELRRGEARIAERRVWILEGWHGTWPAPG